MIVWRSFQEMVELKNEMCCKSKSNVNGRIEKFKVEIQELQDKVVPERFQRIFSMILKLRTALDYPTFPVILWLFRVLVDWLAAILACSLIHGTHLAYQETFFEDLLAPSEPPGGSIEKLEKYGISTMRACDLPIEQKNWREPLRILQFPHGDWQGSFQLGVLTLM